ncbi:hypothetical protein OAS45_03085 [Polaribacter sp.]|nr:hypothetical protein [Polaribacter sp.]MDC1104583.1 hypothetical protein [Polaribacter sp.]MDC1374754.1 hypothetical protein [Polaribacter sp.]
MSEKEFIKKLVAGNQMFEYHFNTNGRYDGSSKSGMQKGLWPSILILLME